MLDHIYSFLLDLQNNIAVRRELGLGDDNQFNAMLSEVNDVRNDPDNIEGSVSYKRGWTDVKVLSKPDISEYGVKASYYLNGAYINRPTAVQYASGFWYVLSYNTTIGIYDRNWSYLGSVPIPYGNPNTYSDRMAGASDFKVDAANDVVYICSSAYHKIKAFKLSDGSLIWEVGNGSAGYMNAGAYYNPNSIDILPNGNVVVSVYRGRWDNTFGYGAIVELSSADGSLVNRLIENTGNGHTSFGQVYQPLSLVVNNNDLFVGTDSDEIGRWDVSGAITYITSYTKGKDFPIMSIDPTALIVDSANNTLIVGAEAIGKVVGIDIDTHDVVWYTGKMGYEDGYNSGNTIGVVRSISDIALDTSGNIVVADYSNNRVTVMPKDMSVQITTDFTIPSGWKAIQYPEGLDLNTKILTVSIDELDSVEDFKLCLCGKDCVCD